jgi:hypothetical protein
MTKEKNIIRLGKHLALLLRHENEAFCDGRIDCHVLLRENITSSFAFEGVRVSELR